MLLDLSALGLGIVILWFAASAAVIALAGSRLARVGDELADRTGLGEAVVGALLIGATTSLPGIITSVSTAAFGYAELAISNAIGGILAQTAFLGIADIAYRKANLEHAAASLANLTFGALLAALLTLPLVAMAAPEVALWGVNPASLVMLGGYTFGLRLASAAEERATWAPRQTEHTQDEAAERAAAEAEPEAEKTPLGRLWASFVLLAACTALAGYGVAEAGVALSERTGLSQTAVGGVLTAVTTSLPELVTAIAAVRAGALKLAVANIIGGNAFDVLFLAFADIAYRQGSIYHAFTNQHVFIVAVAILMTAVLQLGLLRRERWGLGGIGFESVGLLLLYAGAALIMFS